MTKDPAQHTRFRAIENRHPEPDAPEPANVLSGPGESHGPKALHASATPTHTLLEAGTLPQQAE